MASKLATFLALAVFVAVVSYTARERLSANGNLEDMARARAGWAGFRDGFVFSEGRVVRPRDMDTVSEGQSYALLGAVWNDDAELFRRVFEWTDRHLSRERVHGDALLAWRYRDGQIIDTTPASDADVDYALSLFLAARRWGRADYRERGIQVARDALNHYSIALPGNRVILSPWLDSGQNGAPVVINPSYLSPAHYRVFYEETGDKRWLDLVEGSYWLLEQAQALSVNGLFPDWVEVDSSGAVTVAKGRPAAWGWEAVRIPFRLALDYYWYAEPRARTLLEPLTEFLEGEASAQATIFSEYELSGTCSNCFENPLYYSAYSIAFSVTGSSRESWCRRQMRRYAVTAGDKLLYKASDAYFENALSWLADGLQAGVLRNFSTRTPSSTSPKLSAR